MKLDIDPLRFQNELKSRILCSGEQRASTVISSLIADQLEQRLHTLVASGDILRFKVEWRRSGGAFYGRPLCISELAGDTAFSYGSYSVTIVNPLDSPRRIYVQPPENLSWLLPVATKTVSLKTIRKYIIRLPSVGISADILLPVSNELRKACQCNSDCLVPYIEPRPTWLPRFTCKVCGEIYYCECFRAVLKRHYPRAIGEKRVFREGICHLCRGVRSEGSYLHPMYGSKIMVHYRPYIVRTALEKGISEREAENEIRDFLGVPRIGEGWLAEVDLLQRVREIFPTEEVIHQASPDWLGRQRLDIYMPNLGIAIEYQGRQHFKPVAFFGGEKGFLRAQQRDKRKAQLCAENGVALVFFRYDEKITRRLIKARIRKAQGAQ